MKEKIFAAALIVLVVFAFGCIAGPSEGTTGGEEEVPEESSIPTPPADETTGNETPPSLPF